MSIADRAVVAHEHAEEEKRLRTEADKVRRRGIAYDEINVALEEFGLQVEDAELEPDYRAKKWHTMIPIDENCGLYVQASTDEPREVTMRVVPVDELYRDIAPGAENQRHGVYGCYGLNADLLHVRTLADLGEKVVRVRKAREEWNRKHGVSQESEMQKGDSDGTA